MLWYALSLTTAAVFAVVWYRIDTTPNSFVFGCNLGFAWLILFWFYADLCFPRRSIYRYWKRSEGTLKHGLRFWRKVLLLGSTLLSLGLVLNTATVENSTNDARTVAILAGAFLASFGWMYTRFEQDRADRVKATLSALKEHMAGGATQNLLFDLNLFAQHCKKNGADLSKPFSQRDLKAGTAGIDAFNGRVVQTPTHEETSDQILNSYDRLALGVRLGHFEFDTVELAIRSRFIRIAFRYHQNIVKTTGATFDERCGRWRSQSRTWEHFLWLTSKLDVLSTDKVDFEFICLPPDYIVGSRKGEILHPPQSRYTGLFGVDWEVAVNGLQKLAGRPVISKIASKPAEITDRSTFETEAKSPSSPGGENAPIPAKRTNTTKKR